MDLLFLADGRSPIALNWMRHFVEQGHEVHLVSLFPCNPSLNLASNTHIPIPFSELGDGVEAEKNTESWRKRLAGRLATVRVRTAIRHWLVPPALQEKVPGLLQIIDRIRPDLIHAMRIPYEGMLAGLALRGLQIPMILSIWGNDFTLHASSTPQMQKYTRIALQRTDGLHTDCQRDLALAQGWGFAKDKPVVVLPGGGGIRKAIFYPPADEAAERSQPLLINARGLRAYVRNDTVFRAFGMVLQEVSNIRMVCPSMSGGKEGEALAAHFGGEAVDLLPRLPQEELAAFYRKSQVALSITEHDGTPNTLLEAMACGCFPIAGDLPSLRDWIADGENGLLVPPGDARALAKAIVHALRNPDLRNRAQMTNLQLIEERAEYKKVMTAAEAFYRSVIIE
jgi:glycosyltransferase involved in cell wall biosynthesis